MARLEHTYRILGTGLGFAAFGIGGLGLTLIWFPIVRLLFRNPQTRRAISHVSIRFTFNLFLYTVRWLHIIDFEVEGRRELVKARNCLIVANHPSLLDFVFIASMPRSSICIVKEALWHNPFLRGVVDSAGYIPNTEGEDLLEKCRSALTADSVLIVFPEGTRSVPGRDLQIKRGAANIAIRLGIDLQMVSIQCDPPFLLKGTKWYNVPRERPKFVIRVRDRVAIRRFTEKTPYPSVAVRHLNRFLIQYLAPESRIPTS